MPIAIYQTNISFFSSFCNSKVFAYKYKFYNLSYEKRLSQITLQSYKKNQQSEVKISIKKSWRCIHILRHEKCTNYLISTKRLLPVCKAGSMLRQRLCKPPYRQQRSSPRAVPCCPCKPCASLCRRAEEHKEV